MAPARLSALATLLGLILVLTPAGRARAGWGLHRALLGPAPMAGSPARALFGGRAADLAPSRARDSEPVPSRDLDLSMRSRQPSRADRSLSSAASFAPSSAGAPSSSASPSSCWVELQPPADSSGSAPILPGSAWRPAAGWAHVPLGRILSAPVVGNRAVLDLTGTARDASPASRRDLLANSGTTDEPRQQGHPDRVPLLALWGPLGDDSDAPHAPAPELQERTCDMNRLPGDYQDVTVEWSADALGELNAYVVGRRQSDEALASAFGRGIEGMAGIEFAPAGRWSYRLQVTQEFLNKVDAPVESASLSLQFRLRF